MTTAMPQTLADLERSGCQPRTVKAEMRENLIAKIKSGDQLVPGIIGYDDTVIPEIENAVLSCHDMIFLGQRGQAKTRLTRGLVSLLDEYMPVLDGCEINDSPFQPICRRCRDILAEKKGRAKIAWLSRQARYAEKLATPDVTIADLIGDIDPIKVAQGRHLSDELVMHYGLIPRVNRGIFAMNEIPDLHEKIQVGLFNILEERDVQIRGYKVALPLDIIIIATANPEDYTSRGRIITPLKDRFGAQIRTHYPATREEECRIVSQEMLPFQHDGLSLAVPDFMRHIVAEISQTARRKSDVNQSSGISVRMTIHNMETLVSNALRRAIRLHESELSPRITDLAHLQSSMPGKIEWHFIDDGQEEAKIDELVREAIQRVFRETFRRGIFDPFLKTFTDTQGLQVSELTPLAAYMNMLEQYPSLREPVKAAAPQTSPAACAAALEFILEGLSINGRLVKKIQDYKAVYSSSS